MKKVSKKDNPVPSIDDLLKIYKEFRGGRFSRNISTSVLYKKK